MLFQSLSFFLNIVVFFLDLIKPNNEGNMRLKREVVQKSLDSVSVKPNTVTKYFKETSV